MGVGSARHGNKFVSQCQNSDGKCIKASFYHIEDAIEWYWIEKCKAVKLIIGRYPNFKDVIGEYFIHYILKHTELEYLKI